MKSLILFIILNIIVVAESSQNFVWNPKKWLNENENPNETNDISKLKTSLQESKAENEKLKNMISELKHKEKENLKCELKDKQIQECQLNVMLLNQMIKNEPCGENIEEKRVALTFCTKLASEYEIKIFNFTERNQKLESENLRLSNNLKNISGKLQNLNSVMSTKNSEIRNLKSQLSNKLKVIEEKNDALTLCNELSSENTIKLATLTEQNKKLVSENLGLSNNLKNISEELTFLKSVVSTKNSEIKSLSELSDKLKLEIRETYRKNKNLTDNDKRIMVSACQSGDTSVVTAILDLGFNIDTILDYRTCLLITAFENKVDLPKLLMDRNANLEIGDHYNVTPLIKAAHDGHLDMVKLLVERGANLSARSTNSYKKTALGYAKFNSRQDVINYLLSKGAPE